MRNSLRTDWNALSSVQRGFRLKQLKAAGCTNRGLAVDLDCTEGLVRRDLKIAELPASQLRAIEAGANPAPFLKKAEDLTRTQVRDAEITNEQSKQIEIAEVVKAINDFLSDQGVLGSSHRFQIIDEVDHLFWNSGPWRKYRRRPKPPAVTFAKFLSTCRPVRSSVEEAETIPIQIIAEQLAIALDAGVNRRLRDDILQKVKKPYETDRVFSA